MKTWIIILTALGIGLLLISKGFINFAKNDKEERLMLYFNGYSTYAGIGGILRILGWVSLFVDLILVLIYFL